MAILSWVPVLRLGVGEKINLLGEFLSVWGREERGVSLLLVAYFFPL